MSYHLSVLRLTCAGGVQGRAEAQTPPLSVCLRIFPAWLPLSSLLLLLWVFPCQDGTEEHILLSQCMDVMHCLGRDGMFDTWVSQDLEMTSGGGRISVGCGVPTQGAEHGRHSRTQSYLVLLLCHWLPQHSHSLWLCQLQEHTQHCE